MKIMACILVILAGLSSPVLADSTFFDDPNDFFIMANQPEKQASQTISDGGGGSVQNAANESNETIAENETAEEAKVTPIEDRTIQKEKGIPEEAKAIREEKIPGEEKAGMSNEKGAVFPLSPKIIIGGFAIAMIVPAVALYKRMRKGNSKLPRKSKK